MARALRLEHPGAIWHVTSRGNNRGDIYFSDEDRLTFLALLAESVRRFGWLVQAWVLMTNHFHLVIETPDPTLSCGMKWLNQKYAQYVNRKHNRSGHLFHGRFKSFLVERETYLLEVLRYTVLNPVRARMVERPEDYIWSSYRATAGYDVAPGWLTREWTLMQFGPDLATQKASYRAFVDAGAQIERSPIENVVAQLYLGSEAFIERMRILVESKPRSSDHPMAQRYVGRADVQKIVTTVAEVFGESAEKIRSGRGGLERSVTAWLGCYEGMARLGSIATSLSLRSTTRVTQLIADCERRLRNDSMLRIAIDRCLDRLRPSRVAVAAVHRQFAPTFVPR